MNARRTAIKRAEQILRLADPLGHEDLTTAAASPAALASLQRITSTPQEGQGAGRVGGGLPRIVRRAAAAAGALVLVALMGALLVFVRGGDQTTSAHVGVPPLVYSVLDRAQTPQEAALRIPRVIEPSRVAMASVRIADIDGGDRYIFFDDTSGSHCLLLATPEGGRYSGCGGFPSRPRGSLAGGTAAGNRRLLYGAVPDAITEVVIGGRTIPVENNVFHTELEPLVRTAPAIDFRTAEGVVVDWHEPARVAEPPVAQKEPAFGSQARLLQTRIPYLGVYCPGANSFACDRVGLAVYLRKPARKVVAKIAGRRVVLDDPDWSGPEKDGLRRKFAGFLQPAGLIDGPRRIRVPAGTTRWTGRPPLSLWVNILVTYRDGSLNSARMQVPLSPGWG